MTWWWCGKKKAPRQTVMEIHANMMLQNQLLHLQQMEAVIALTTSVLKTLAPNHPASHPPHHPASPPESVVPPDTPPSPGPTDPGTPSDDSVIYVLKLAHDKWYVGMCQGRRMEQRLREHKNRVGSSWTSAHSVEELVEVVPRVNKWHEDNKTKEYMERYGIDNVRGGTYAKPKLSADTIKMLTAEMRHNNGLCIRCGESGHMIKQCRRSSPQAQDGEAAPPDADVSAE